MVYEAVACEQQIKAAYSLVAEKAVTAFWDSESNLVPVFNVDESNNPLNWHGAGDYPLVVVLRLSLCRARSILTDGLT